MIYESSTNSVAVWFVDDFDRTRYDLFDTEADAAVTAAGLERGFGPGAVLGVQFADGRTIPAGEWAALEEGHRRLREFDAARPPVAEPSNTIRDPFNLTEVEVACGDPAWLGLPRDQTGPVR